MQNYLALQILRNYHLQTVNCKNAYILDEVADSIFVL